MSKAELPVPERLSQWGTGTEIIYCCPNCNISFAILGCKEKFCHNCGTKINWNVPIMASSEFASEYHNSNWDKQKEMIRILRCQILKIKK